MANHAHVALLELAPHVHVLHSLLCGFGRNAEAVVAAAAEALVVTAMSTEQTQLAVAAKQTLVRANIRARFTARFVGPVTMDPQDTHKLVL